MATEIRFPFCGAMMHVPGFLKLWDFVLFFAQKDGLPNT
jgi:hypothetical protein